MAVFLVNTCKFSGCRLTFATLADLIQHIEETHLDKDPQILEKLEIEQPPSLALSYVLRVFTDGVSKDRRPRPSSVSPVSFSSFRSVTPTGSEFDEDGASSAVDDSDDPWTTQEEFTSDVILRMMINAGREEGSDKPFLCPVPGCKKRYKNINGIKYHAKHSHKKEIRIKKPHKCYCGKNYKTLSKLQNHLRDQHGLSTPSARESTRTTEPAAKCSETAKVKCKKKAGANGVKTKRNFKASLQTLGLGFPQTILRAPAGFLPGQTGPTLVTLPIAISKLTSSSKDIAFIPQTALSMVTSCHPANSPTSPVTGACSASTACVTTGISTTSNSTAITTTTISLPVAPVAARCLGGLSPCDTASLGREAPSACFPDGLLEDGVDEICDITSSQVNMPSAGVCVRQSLSSTKGGSHNFLNALTSGIEDAPADIFDDTDLEQGGFAEASCHKLLREESLLGIGN